MIRLRDKDTGAELGEITEEELQFLEDQLEEEFSDDTDYYISRDELRVLKEQGDAPAHLLEMLELALGDRDGLEVQWIEE